MKTGDLRLLYALCMACFAVFTRAKICEKLDSTLFSACVKAGIDSTLAGSLKLSERVIISSLTSETIKELGRCSPYTDFLVCSVSVPKCTEGVYKPVVPCRRVCEDVARGCDVHRVRNGNVEWLKGLCKLLPNEDRKTGKCIEPKGFKPLQNQVPLQKRCTKLFLPQCQGFGFNYTIKSFIEQLYLSRHFNSLLNKTDSSGYCESVIRAFLCTELLPPCFQDKHSDPAIYTVCKSRCKVLWEECPAVLRKQIGIFENCAMASEQGTEYEGFCRVTEWPGTNKWEKANSSNRQVVDSTRLRSNTGPAIHTMALTITFSLVTTIAILATAVYCFMKRRRVFNFRGYWQHGDEQEEEEMAVIVNS